MNTLNVPPYSTYWTEDGLVKPKRVAKTMCNGLYIDVLLRLDKPLY